MISFTVQGSKELENMLNRLPDKLATKAIRPGVRAALKPVLAAMKANIKALPISKRRKGKLRALMLKNVKIWVFKKKKKGRYGMHAGYKGGDEAFIYVAAAAIEFGHDNVPAIPILRSAFDANRVQMGRIFEDIVGAEIKKIWETKTAAT